MRIWRRWRIVTVALILLALAGAAATLTGQRAYQSTSSVILLASRSAAKQNGGNPYLSFSPSLTLAADAVGQEVMAPPISHELATMGFRDPYTVALAPYTTNTTGSVLVVAVTGSDKAGVEQTLHAVTSEISVELLQLQSNNHIKPHNRIRAMTLSYTPQATLSVSKTARPVVAVTALGLLLALGIPIIADGLLARRRLRRHQAQLPKGAAEPADPAPAGRLPAHHSQGGHGRQAAGASLPDMTHIS